MIQPKLKDCPFCGTDKVFYFIKNGSVKEICVYVQCMTCGVKTETKPTSKEVAEIWNRRVGNGN